MTKSNSPKNTGVANRVGLDDPGYATSGLIHSIRLPEKVEPNQPIPAVVMVHGWGGDESVMWIFKQVIPAGVAIITPRAPIELDSGGYIWFHQAGQRLRPEPGSLQKAMARLEHFLNTLPELYPIDPQQLVLIGFSQGAAVINSLVTTRPVLVSGLASLSGQLPEGLAEQGRNNSLAGLPVFIAHGAEDDIVPLREAQRTRDTYTRLGADVTYGQYPVGHKMNTQGMSDLKAWVAKVIKPALNSVHPIHLTVDGRPPK